MLAVVTGRCCTSVLYVRGRRLSWKPKFTGHEAGSEVRVSPPVCGATAAVRPGVIGDELAGVFFAGLVVA